LAKLRLTMACWNYDRTRALADGRVRVEGVELNYLDMPVEETFFRMLRHREFDVAEMSLSSYVLSLFQPEPPFIAIPVFPSRVFRHSAIFINTRSGITTPADLIGKNVGLPEYQLTANVWIRGILEEHYGVPAASVSYFTGGQESPGRREKLTLQLPAEFRIERIAPDKTLADMLANAEIDAFYGPRTPSTFYSKPACVRRLFPDFKTVEQEYFKQTGIFPIMHTVVIRRDVYDRHRWVAQSLYKAFAEAQRLTCNDLIESSALKTMLPWLIAHVEETRRVMGHEFWPYGVAPNRATLETFLRYSHEQGLAKTVLRVEQLFAPESLEAFTI
jgi:4,5-dihydroxyphthalate decarboxylase